MGGSSYNFLVEQIPSVGIGSRSALGLILLTVCFFCLTKFLCRYFPLPGSVAEKSQNDPFRVFRWHNLLVSWIHATITGAWTVTCLIVYRNEMWKDMLTFRNWPCFGVCCFSTGYFIYDTLDIVFARRVREKWEILVHHTAIVVIAVYAVASVTGVGYHVLSMSIEFNTAFLHFRKLLQLAGVPRTSLLLQCNRYLNLVTFMIFRFGPLALLFHAVYQNFHRIPLWFAILFLCAMIVLSFVNFVLFVRLVRADCRGWFFTLDSAPTQQIKARVLGHRKLDSYAGVCGSMQVSEDLAPGGDRLTFASGSPNTSRSQLSVGNGAVTVNGTNNYPIKLSSDGDLVNRKELLKRRLNASVENTQRGAGEE